jgi:hypothetical protein
MAWAYDVWGWNGWLVAVAIPLCIWAFLVLVLALVLRRSPAGAVAPLPDEQPAATRLRDSGSLGWRPPVPSHH